MTWEVRMYTCTVCGNDYPYLIFEYNSLVCEACSIRKNISNCGELESEPVMVIEEEFEDVEEEDAEQLIDLMQRIENPRIREDFLALAEEYIQGFNPKED